MHIVTAKEMYEMDQYAIKHGGIDGKILMESAGRAVSSKVEALIERSSRILILIGSGNNGGDGFVIARTLMNQGFSVTTCQLVADCKIKGDASYHKQVFENYGGAVQLVENAEELLPFLDRADIVVDAILGIGFSGQLRGSFVDIIQLVNESQPYVISVDIPSGVPADEGNDLQVGIKANYTVIIEAPKMSAFIEKFAPFYGKWEVVKIGLPKAAFKLGCTRMIWTDSERSETLPKRETYSHKGNHGKGLIIGGCLEMPGSVAMTAKAALRSGAGLITIGTVPEAIPSISSYCREATYRSLTSESGFIVGDPMINFQSYGGIAIGMGMGRNALTATFTRKVVTEAAIPVLIDADGLYHVKKDLDILLRRDHPTILTPHPGEMAMLVDKSIQDVLLRPFSLAKQFASKYRVYLVLKGKHTIVTDPFGNQWVNPTGNAGLAKGGSGDVLSGILLTMLMQSESVQKALSNGCFLHGKSADELISSKHAKQDLLATDVIDGLAAVFRTIS
ncbi:NAD(P)H-hydrate dehydratase [Aquibacillus kalidii]|uniref:NAD(P)H-hydrate dehydratase n=1 Tax=Aquibacillus kalidii TaxID=2762597 RepID=UPI0016441B96|nr:NAD(P)H-hydrate dehydratase [Aquibacillus kalidii]